MKHISLTLITLISSFVPASTAYAQPSLFKVLNVVDGDTIRVDVRGNKETVRLLGIDTPEAKDPRKSVQCFGLAATEKMKSLVSNQSVILIDESTQGSRDKYNRLLRYVYLPDAKRTFVNGEMVKQGYAFSYKEYPTKMLDKFNAFEVYARENNLGLWAACSTPIPTVKPTTPVQVLKTLPKKVGTPTKTFNAPSAKPTVYEPPVKTAPPVQSSSGGDKDCGDFRSHSEAQAFFLANGGPGSDPHRLDADHDGDACETL